jgi:demethylmenaquinone methyltransferase/2-methoxy-6-polyprenyl-1,4-benzoquinol methylase
MCTLFDELILQKKWWKHAERRYSGLPNVQFELQNVEELYFPQDYFDAITCFGLFPHIENKQRALLK